MFANIKSPTAKFAGFAMVTLVVVLVLVCEPRKAICADAGRANSTVMKHHNSSDTPVRILWL
jgi:hypothetical protein